MDTVEIEVATQVADGGLDLEICQGDTGFLNANPAQNGTWVLQNGFTSIEDPNAPETACFDAIPGPTELVWTLDNGVCITADTILLFTWESPDLANAGPDQSLGAVTTTQLAGNEPQVGWGVWSSISGPGSLVIQQDSVFNTLVTGLETGGVYVLEWTIGNGICPPSSDLVTLELAGFVIPQLITANGDGKNDTWEIIGLENFGPAKVTILNRWGTTVFKTDDYQNDWAGNSQKGEALTDDTYFYLLELPNGESHQGYIVLKR